MHELGSEYLESVTSQLRGLKRKGEHGIEQLSDEKLFHFIDEESNSVAMLIHHLWGNMMSRWTNFLEEDGEKTTRDRPSEFFMDFKVPRSELMKMWEEGWNLLFNALGDLKPEDLLRTVTIRGEPHSVVRAINRQLGHYSEHVGQILLLAKHLVGEEWRSPTIPRERKTSK